MSELQLEQQIPFSASLTFEQSYSEVDGDSASMAELCALISALANVPVNQNIAITGSVDQFGRAQPVGGLNEKIEGFFAICAEAKQLGIAPGEPYFKQKERFRRFQHFFKRFQSTFSCLRTKSTDVVQNFKCFAHCSNLKLILGWFVELIIER